VIHAIAPERDRALAEMEGIFLVAVFGVLAITAKGFEDHFRRPQRPQSLGDALRIKSESDVIAKS
jgi:hypothetical protein